MSGLGGRRFEIDGDVGQAFKLAPETEPEVGAHRLHKAFLSGSPARNAVLQDLHAGLCEAYKSLATRGSLGNGKESLLLELG